MFLALIGCLVLNQFSPWVRVGLRTSMELRSLNLEWEYPLLGFGKNCNYTSYLGLVVKNQKAHWLQGLGLSKLVRRLLCSWWMWLLGGMADILASSLTSLSDSSTMDLLGKVKMIAQSGRASMCNSGAGSMRKGTGATYSIGGGVMRQTMSTAGRSCSEPLEI